MTMAPFVTVRGAAIPLLRGNVDTDMIIRVERMLAFGKEALRPFALEALRYLPDGRLDPDALLNQPVFADAPILLAGMNFGSGSSREPAVWALKSLGLRCIVAPSFGDIFFSNCFQNGVLPIRLPLEVIEALAALCGEGAPVGVDLRDCTLTPPGGAPIPFAVDPLRREALLQGLDDLGLTLQDDALIAQWQRDDRLARPWVWASPARIGARRNSFEPFSSIPHDR